MIAGRRGARRPSEVPVEVLERLVAGEQSANHMEQIAVDMGAVLAAQFPSLAAHASELQTGGLVCRMRAGGRLLWREFGLGLFAEASCWPSDITRGWAAMAVNAVEDITLQRRLELIEPFADDAHFAVREWAWLALRAHVAADVDGAVAALPPWTMRQSSRLRRFASEVTRPRGVWSAHIRELKRDPERGRGILEPLRADSSRSVQDSVANWLNDASKSAPVWTESTCARWLRESPRLETARIVKRGLRTLRKLDAAA